MNLEWYCMEWDSNGNKPYAINIMWVIDPDEIKKRVKYKGNKPSKYNSIKTYDELREYLKSQFMYRFWSKCEHEIVVNSWPHRDDTYETKVDVYAQISPNLDRITEYVINALKLELKPKKTEHNNDFGLERSK